MTQKEQLKIDVKMLMLWMIENDIKSNEFHKIANHFYKNTTYQFQHSFAYYVKLEKLLINEWI